jgi:hypothetical protein
VQTRAGYVVFFGGAEGGTLRVGDELQQEFDEVFLIIYIIKILN